MTREEHGYQAAEDASYESITYTFFFSVYIRYFIVCLYIFFNECFR
jgi:hypothetical protein